LTDESSVAGQSLGATTFGRTVYLTAHDERRLRDLLAALQDWGFA